MVVSLTETREVSASLWLCQVILTLQTRVVTVSVTKTLNSTCLLVVVTVDCGCDMKHTFRSVRDCADGLEHGGYAFICEWIDTYKIRTCLWLSQRNETRATRTYLRLCNRMKHE